VNESQRRAWAALGVGPPWRLRAPHAADGPDEAHRDEAHAGVASMDWTALRESVAGCRACRLSEGRTQTVFGVGDTAASWLFVGEAPGEEEDRRGEPFVGKAGQLLDRMLAALGMTREHDVFIANVLKCRPPHNRDPLPEERARCDPYLRRQIDLLAPRVVVALGRIAAQALLDTEASLASLRGRVHSLRIGDRSFPVVVTYHPAYLLRTPADKARAWADLCLARDVHAGTA
jgi:DNA polymerase